jgi:hypothetical protein
MPIGSIILAAVSTATAIASGAAQAGGTRKARRKEEEIIREQNYDQRVADRVSNYLRQREIDSQRAIGERALDMAEKEKKEGKEKADEKEVWKRFQGARTKLENIVNSSKNLQSNFLAKLKSKNSMRLT